MCGGKRKENLLLSWSVNLTSVRDLTAKADSTKRSRLEGTVAAFLSVQVRMRGMAPAAVGGAPHATAPLLAPINRRVGPRTTLPHTSVEMVTAAGRGTRPVPGDATRTRCGRWPLPGIVCCAWAGLAAASGSGSPSISSLAPLVFGHHESRGGGGSGSRLTCRPPSLSVTLTRGSLITQ